MQIPKKPKNEKERIESLHELEVLDTEAEKSLDDITKLAAEICNVPICLISLIDEDRQWFKSKQGLTASETPRDLAFCAHAILDDKIMEVENAKEDERFQDNPLVNDDPNVIFYAGAPLITPDKHALGTLCVIDNKPGKLNDFQKRSLEVLSKQVSNYLELRRNINRLAKAKVNEAALAVAATYAHEVNNPLHIAVGNLSIIKNEIEPDRYEKISGAHNRIARAINKMGEVLKKSEITLKDYSGNVKLVDLDEE